MKFIKFLLNILTLIEFKFNKNKFHLKYRKLIFIFSNINIITICPNKVDSLI